MHDCQYLFKSCSWNDKPVDCCKLFSTQVTEFGICYSFNSYTNAGTSFLNVSLLKSNSYYLLRKLKIFQKSSPVFPLRISEGGTQTALAVKLNVLSEIIVQRPNNPQPGLFVIIGDPSEWPNFGYSLAPGINSWIGITPTLYTTSPDLRAFTPEKRDCYYDVTANHS